MSYVIGYQTRGQDACSRQRKSGMTQAVWCRFGRITCTDAGKQFTKGGLSVILYGDECCLFDHCTGRNATSLLCWLLTCMRRIKETATVVCCEREAQCDRRTKSNWTKTSHRKHIHLSLVSIHTHRCDVACWALGLLKVSAHGSNHQHWRLKQRWCCVCAAESGFEGPQYCWSGGKTRSACFGEGAPGGTDRDAEAEQTSARWTVWRGFKHYSTFNWWTQQGQVHTGWRHKASETGLTFDFWPWSIVIDMIKASCCPFSANILFNVAH